MKYLLLASALALSVAANPVDNSRITLPKVQGSKHLRYSYEKRDLAGFSSGQPIDGNGKGAPLLGKSSSCVV